MMTAIFWVAALGRPYETDSRVMCPLYCLREPPFCTPPNVSHTLLLWWMIMGLANHDSRSWKAGRFVTHCMYHRNMLTHCAGLLEMLSPGPAYR